MQSSTQSDLVPNGVQRGDVCTKPINSSHPLILSDTIDVGPFSFLDAKFQKEKPRLPPPVYLSMPTLSKEKAIDNKDQIFSSLGLEVTGAGELKLVDENMIKSQRGVVLDVAKQLAKNVIEGKGSCGSLITSENFRTKIHP